MRTLAVATGWDRTTRCCKEGCTNPRGKTSAGLPSLSCQYHTDQWEARLRQVIADHGSTPPDAFRPSTRVQPVQFTPPTPPPSGPLDDAQLCSRCGMYPREFPDHLCEECRRG